MSKGLGLKIMSLRGVPVYLKPSWFVMMIIMLAGIGYYLGSISSLQGIEPYIVSALLAFLVALGVFLHEGAHALTGLARGQRVIYISMTLWGGVTKLSPGTAVTSLIVSLAGPIVNLIYAGLIWLIAEVLGASAAGIGFSLAASANLLISLFNLIPAYPLDGGHALEAFVTLFTRLRSVGIKVTAWSTLMLIPLLIALFIVCNFTLSIMNVVVLLAVCSFLWSAGYSALTSAGAQSSNSDRLTVANLREIALPVSWTEELVDVATRWDGASYIIVFKEDQAIAWAGPQELRHAIEDGNFHRSIASLTHRIAPLSIPLKGKRIDTLDYFNGSVFADLDVEFREGTTPLAYPIEEKHQTVGLLVHRKISDTLYAESAYLRR